VWRCCRYEASPPRGGWRRRRWEGPVGRRVAGGRVLLRARSPVPPIVHLQVQSDRRGGAAPPLAPRMPKCLSSRRSSSEVSSTLQIGCLTTTFWPNMQTTLNQEDVKDYCTLEYEIPTFHMKDITSTGKAIPVFGVKLKRGYVLW